MWITGEESSYITVKFDGGIVVLRNGMRENELEIVFLKVCKDHRGKGIAQAALKMIKEHFRDHILIPIDIVETAVEFWELMKHRGLVQF